MSRLTNREAARLKLSVAFLKESKTLLDSSAEHCQTMAADERRRYYERALSRLCVQTSEPSRASALVGHAESEAETAGDLPGWPGEPSHAERTCVYA